MNKKLIGFFVFDFRHQCLHLKENFVLFDWVQEQRKEKKNIFKDIPVFPENRKKHPSKCMP